MHPAPDQSSSWPLLQPWSRVPGLWHLLLTSASALALVRCILSMAVRLALLRHKSDHATHLFKTLQWLTPISHRARARPLGQTTNRPLLCCTLSWCPSPLSSLIMLRVHLPLCYPLTKLYMWSHSGVLVLAMLSIWNALSPHSSLSSNLIFSTRSSSLKTIFNGTLGHHYHCPFFTTPKHTSAPLLCSFSVYWTFSNILHKLLIYFLSLLPKWNFCKSKDLCHFVLSCITSS